MNARNNKILVVGDLCTKGQVFEQLEDASHQYSAQIIFFRPEELDIEQIFETNQDWSQEKNIRAYKVPTTTRSQKIFSIPAERQLATAMIQEHEHRNREESLPFHDKLHANHMLWYRIQTYLHENHIDSLVFYCCKFDLVETVLYQIAESHGLNVLILQQSLFDGRLFSYRSLTDLGKFSPNVNSNLLGEVSEAVNLKQNIDSEKQEPCTESKLTSVLQVVRFLVRARSFKLWNPTYVLKRARHLQDAPLDPKNWRDEFARFFYCKRTDYFDFFTNDFDENMTSEQFVYFPLQSLSELNTEILTSNFGDQLLAIEQLSKLLPTNCKIIVKGVCGAEPDYLTPMFFHRIKRISNVVRVPNRVDSISLIDKCEFVATVNSQLGWDALANGKKVLLFGNPWYRSLPGAILYHHGIQYKEVSELAFSLFDLKRELQILLARSHCVELSKHSDSSDLNQQAKENAKEIATTIYDLVFKRIETTFCAQNESDDTAT